jgi:uncharacterized small protein (TIGR04563 family)
MSPINLNHHLTYKESVMSDNELSAFLASLGAGKPVSTGKRGRPANPNTPPIEDRKTSVYFGGNELAEIREVAARLDRSVSWVLATSFSIAKDQLASMATEDPA